VGSWSATIVVPNERLLAGGQIRAFRAKNPLILRPGGSVARLLATKRPVQVADYRELEAYKSGDPSARALGDLGGARTVLWVPLLKDGAVIGWIVVYWQEVRPFSGKQIALLENFASQAVIAMENARLLTETREALEQQTATAEVLQVINASPGNLAPVFDAMLEKAMALCHASGGALRSYDGELFHAVAVRGVPAAFSDFTRKVRAAPYTALGRTAAGERIIQIVDLADPQDPASRYPNRREMIELGGIRTALWVALRRDDVFLGTFVLYRSQVKAFSQREIALVENFAAQAVIAMENARLLNEIRQRQEELRITFENIGDGVVMFDETQHLAAWNRKFQDILDVPDDIIARRQTFSEDVHYLAERGEYDPGADPEEHVRGLIEHAGQSRTCERTRPNGRVIEIRHNPVPGGGFVLIFSDVTERKRSEAEIRAARDAAEEASSTIEAAYRDLKIAQANLIQAEKMASLGQLTAGIADEIKNPLNFVNNFAALSVDLLSELKEAAAPGFAALTNDQRAEIEDVSATLTSNLGKITEHGKTRRRHSEGNAGTLARVIGRTPDGRSKRTTR
jgi:two-component system, NtrC family, sensor kinase